MAADESLTPEQQLLKLIENPTQASVRVESVKREGEKLISLPALKGRVDFWKAASMKRWFSLKQFSQSPHAMKRINGVLKFLIFVMVIYSGYTLYGMVTGIKKASNLILPSQKTAVEVPETVTALQSVSYYLGKTKGRNIFTPVVPEKPQEETKPAEGVEEENPFKTCNLVGIAWSDNPEAMVEDKGLGRTFFVRRGQLLANGLRVVTIFKDKVILSYKGKEYELR
ncbi:MAG: hypothetical protein V1882_07745 [Candidatus Omnitrophota bacterium]